MVQILEERPSFGGQLARNLGAGLGAGMSQASQFAQQMAGERFKKEQKRQLIEQANDLGGSQSSQSTQGSDQEFIDALSQIEKHTGQELNPQQVDELWNRYSQIKGIPSEGRNQEPTESDHIRRSKRLATIGEHDLSRIELEQERMNRKEKFANEQKEKEILSIGPKKFLEGVEDYRKSSRDIDLALGAELDAVLRGEVDPFSSGHIAQLMKDFNLPPSLSTPLETVGSKAFRTGQKTFLTKTFKDAFRGATTQGQVALASSLLAESGAPMESNLASVWFLQSQHLISKENVRLTDEALEKGVSPYKLSRYVDKQLDEYAKDINDQYFEALKSLRERIGK